MKLTKLLNKINTYNNYESFLFDLQIMKKTTIISFLNAHAVNLSFSNKFFFHTLLKSDFLLRDGVGIKFAFWLFGMDPKYNLNGTDLIPYILSKFPKKRLSVYGSRQKVLKKFYKKYKKQLNIVSFVDGFCEKDIYFKDIEENKPEIILLAMGMPKQEFLSSTIKESFPKHKFLVINGGAIIDFMSNSITRAPVIYRKTGLEWLFRLIKEPRRLFKRYVIGNILFLGILFWDYLNEKNFNNKS